MRAVMAAACLLAIVVSACGNGRHFDPETWRHGDARARGRMVDDLRSREILLGKTRTDVVELLGEPDTERDEMMLWSVDLGHRFGSDTWPYTLYVSFDENTGQADAVFTTD